MKVRVICGQCLGFRWQNAQLVGKYLVGENKTNILVFDVGLYVFGGTDMDTREYV